MARNHKRVGEFALTYSGVSGFIERIITDEKGKRIIEIRTEKGKIRKFSESSILM